MNTKLSIIIPFYGNANKTLLDRCIKSIKEQRIEPDEYEIIIADDNGQGVYSARNIGLKQAKGEYIFFVDADDFIFPDTLKRCLYLLTKKKPDMLSFGFQHINNSKTHIINNDTYKETYYTSGADYMLHHNYFGTVWRFFIRRELILEKGLTFHLKTHHQDEIFCAEAYFIAKSIIDISLTVYAYCSQSGSLVHHRGKAQRLERIADFRNILTTLLLFLKEHPQATEIQKKALERRIHFLTIDFLWQLIRNKCTFIQFRQQLRTLSIDGLLPLPAKGYSTKYKLARLFINRFMYPFL